MYSTFRDLAIIMLSAKSTDLDKILAPGGAIQGHPMGSQAGVRAMFAAVEAAMNGTSLEEAARQCPELETIRHLWKKEA